MRTSWRSIQPKGIEDYLKDLCMIYRGEMDNPHDVNALMDEERAIQLARSNLVAIVLGAQDKSQLNRDYGEKESEVIFNTVGNIFAGQVNGKTAEDLSKSFGKEFRKRESQTRGIEQDSVNISFQHEELLPLSTIETLSQGVFFGKVAETMT